MEYKTITEGNIVKMKEATPMIEKKATCVQGFTPFLLLITLCIGVIYTGKFTWIREEALYLFALIIPLVILWLRGFFIVSPNEGKILTFFGKYTGTVRTPGLWFANPFASRERISLKVNNYQSHLLKINDAQGNPINAACVIVWRVVDTAKAAFEVQDYNSFVQIQCETALRQLANHYPYESHDTGEISLHGSPEKVSETLQQEVQSRVKIAGIEILEAQLSRLAYSPEIAQAMLRRQQAAAVIGARQVIVEGAVSMVEMALKKLEDDSIVSLDEQNKSIMVNNLMIALVSESHVQPVLATSSAN
ncbi:MAG: SPFH domain-containing protein [Luteolibacter sp.]